MIAPLLPYPAFPEGFGRADFHVSDSNEAALRWIDGWPDWQSSALLLYGPQGCGKTHLARIWQTRAEAALVAGGALAEQMVPGLVAAAAVAVDDADGAPEQALLHLVNACREARRHLLLTAQRPAGEWPVALADLGSRLRAMAAVGIAAPDDALLAALLVKHFSDRQLQVRKEVIAFLAARMERSHAAAAALAAQLAEAGGEIGFALARSALAQPSPSSGGSRVA